MVKNISQDKLILHEHMVMSSPLRQGAYQVSLAFNIQKFSSEWEQAAPADNVFLQLPYLSTLQQLAPSGMEFCYAIFYNKRKPIGVAYFQVQHFKADQSIVDEDTQDSPCFFSAVAKYFKNLVARKVVFNTLVCGNLLLTGKHGFYFAPEAIKPPKAYQLLADAMILARDMFEKKGVPITVFLSKDYPESLRPFSSTLISEGFNEFTVQPNMVLPIRPEWERFDDYLADFQSKYRVRARRAFKKADKIEKKELSVNDIAENIDLIDSLYFQVVKNVDFNVVRLHPKYFLGLKESLGEKCCLTGYYLSGKLIGFYTTIDNGSELEAHFLGLNQSINKEYQIYLNMLYDMVDYGITLRKERLVFARTALEIKSSVGAVPEEMYCYLRHRNPVSNKFTPTLFEYLRPKTDWIQRNPFKDSPA